MARERAGAPLCRWTLDFPPHALALHIADLRTDGLADARAHRLAHGVAHGLARCLQRALAG